MTIDGAHDVEGLKRAGSAVARALAAMRAAVRPGITPRELDEIGARVLAENGARSAPQLAYDFPAATCISVGDAVAHGIAGDTPLAEGTLLNIDVSAERDGYWADAGESMVAGTPTRPQQRLLTLTRTAQRTAMMKARAGRKLNVIGRTIEQAARRGGYRIVESLNGHGVGRSIHEAPTVPNWYDASDETRLWEGLVITIEPFLTSGAAEIYTDEDGWTLRVADGAPTAQFEHSFIVTRGRPIVLTESEG